MPYKVKRRTRKRASKRRPRVSKRRSRRVSRYRARSLITKKTKTGHITKISSGMIPAPYRGKYPIAVSSITNTAFGNDQVEETGVFTNGLVNLSQDVLSGSTNMFQGAFGTNIPKCFLDGVKINMDIHMDTLSSFLPIGCRVIILADKFGTSDIDADSPIFYNTSLDNTNLVFGTSVNDLPNNVAATPGRNSLLYTLPLNRVRYLVAYDHAFVMSERDTDEQMYNYRYQLKDYIPIKRELKAYPDAALDLDDLNDDTENVTTSLSYLNPNMKYQIITLSCGLDNDYDTASGFPSPEVTGSITTYCRRDARAN